MNIDIKLHKEDLPDQLELGDKIAVDCEFTGLNVERDHLCLVQISTGNNDAHIVQLKRQTYNAPNLKKILTDKNCLKIFHFARFDVAVFKRYLDIDCQPIYCTKIASKLVRTYTDKHGLKDLCKETLNIDLSKQQQSSNWGAEELTEDQKKYAASDVIYLHKIKSKLDEQLIKMNRQDMANECFSFIKTRVDLDLKGWPDIDIFSH